MEGDLPKPDQLLLTRRDSFTFGENGIFWIRKVKTVKNMKEGPLE